MRALCANRSRLRRGLARILTNMGELQIEADTLDQFSFISADKDGKQGKVYTKIVLDTCADSKPVSAEMKSLTGAFFATWILREVVLLSVRSCSESHM